MPALGLLLMLEGLRRARVKGRRSFGGVVPTCSGRRPCSSALTGCLPVSFEGLDRRDAILGVLDAAGYVLLGFSISSFADGISQA
jgi:hypothetical protein